jgi:ABC-type nitrate/sulfonate/bicarbonate transport system permease component
VRGIDPRLIEVGRMLGLSPARRTLKLALPAAIPGIMVGVRVAAGIAIVVTITTEIVANPRGLGHRDDDGVAVAAGRSRVGDAALGRCRRLGCQRRLLAIEQRWLRWYWAGRA